MTASSYTTGRLEVKVDDGTITLDGQLDERCDLSPIAEQIDGNVQLRPVISFINSIGVREWIRLLHALRERGCAIRLDDCSEALVHQMNMIIEAQAGSTIGSFYAPYACDACGHEASMKLDMDEHSAALKEQNPPNLACPECGGEMEFNEIVDRYLLFLSHGS